MTELSCSVVNCIHNCDRLCEMGTIEVKGRSAEESEYTCCSTFSNAEGSTRNAADNAEPETSIDCSAEACKYNVSLKCKAEHVTISGAGASNSEKTECSTFVVA